jgi:hypothetical protein
MTIKTQTSSINIVPNFLVINKAHYFIKKKRQSKKIMASNKVAAVLFITLIIFLASTEVGEAIRWHLDQQCYDNCHMQCLIPLGSHGEDCTEFCSHFCVRFECFFCINFEDLRKNGFP